MNNYCYPVTLQCDVLFSPQCPQFKTEITDVVNWVWLAACSGLDKASTHYSLVGKSPSKEWNISKAQSPLGTENHYYLPTLWTTDVNVLCNIMSLSKQMSKNDFKSYIFTILFDMVNIAFPTNYSDLTPKPKNDKTWNSLLELKDIYWKTLSDQILHDIAQLKIRAGNDISLSDLQQYVVQRIQHYTMAGL